MPKTTSAQEKGKNTFVARYGEAIVRGGIAAIPYALFRYQGELGLTPQQVWFISAILGQKWTTQLPCPSLKKMAIYTGVSRVTLNKIKNELIGNDPDNPLWLRVIERINKQGGKASSYYDFSPLFEKLVALLERDKPLHEQLEETIEDEKELDPPHVNTGLHTHVNMGLHTPVNTGLHVVNTEEYISEINKPDINISKDENRKQGHYVNNDGFQQPDATEQSAPVISNGVNRRGRGRPRKNAAGKGDTQDTAATPKLEPSKNVKDLPPPENRQPQQQLMPLSEVLQQYTGLGLSPAFIQQAVTPPNKKDEEWHDLKTFFSRGFSVELHDEANITSTVTRAYNLFKRKQEQHPTFDFGAFIGLMYEAKSITQDRSGSITKKNEHGFKTKMAYFFAVLEDKLGFKEKPTRAD